MKAGWVLVALASHAVGMGCSGGPFRQSADEYCDLEEARAIGCGAEEDFDRSRCLARMESCRGRDVEVLDAFSDCLDDLGYGVCGACIAEELTRSCSGDPAPEDLAAVEQCERTLFDELSNRCADEFDGCGNVSVSTAMVFVVPLTLVGRRRRQPGPTG